MQDTITLVETTNGPWTTEDGKSVTCNPALLMLTLETAKFVKGVYRVKMLDGKIDEVVWLSEATATEHVSEIAMSHIVVPRDCEGFKLLTIGE